MYSPVDRRARLKRVKLEEGLNVYKCPASGGYWIPAQDYWIWLSSQPERLPQLPAPPDGEGTQSPESAGASAEEPKSMLLCPESGTPMSRFRVGHHFRFSIDRSMTGGIWLDAGEWEALQQRNFHDELHLIFTAPWQRHVREQLQVEARIRMLKNRVGEQEWAEVEHFQAWLNGLDEGAQSAVIAYISERE